MPTIFIPQQRSQFKLNEDWTTDLSWAKRNLVLLRNLKYTGQKAQYVGKTYSYDKSSGRFDTDPTGNLLTVDKYVNRTVPNPLFKDDEGKMIPVQVVFPSETVFELTRYNTGYNGFIASVWLKVIRSTDKRFTSRCVEVNIDQLANLSIEVL